MKNLTLILIVALIIIPVYAVSQYTSTMAPVWQHQGEMQAQHNLDVQAQRDAIETEQQRQRAQDWTELQRDFLMILILGVGGTIVYLLWERRDKRRESWARAVDGTFALQQHGPYILDPNKSVFGVFGVDKQTGNLISDANMVGPDRQLTYSLDVQKTRTAAAVTGGDGFRYSATGKFLAGAYDRPARPEWKLLDNPDQELPPNWTPLTIQDAFAQSERFNWIIGQNKKTGALCTINPKENSHLGIVGSNGTGKTAFVALLLMAYALRFKFRVVILDGKGGADWSRFRNMVEYSKLDYSNVSTIVDQLYAEYERRQTMLNDYQVNSIWELPKHAGRPRPTLIIVDEFGAVMDSLKAADKTKYKSVEVTLGNLLRLSRGAGLYLMPCDQNPTKWPGTMRANLPVNICFRLGGGIGGAVNEYNLDQLDRVGHFQVAGVDYHAWPTYQVVDDLLATIEYQKPKALLTMQAESPLKDGQSSPTIDDPSIADGGEGQAHPPPNNYRRTIDTPENYSQTIDEAIEAQPPIDGAKPLLKGKPLSETERALVCKTYQETRDYKKTCEILWGKWNPGRDKWVKEIIR
ncbi:MAG: FtsK/SpoIIIE domain-containing protein [Caldilineaceae bacterium]